MVIQEISDSPFKTLQGIEYFNFEEDFVEENVRCIPMIVRFKMDKAGIKLKLAEWSKFKTEEKIELAVKSCSTNEEIIVYNKYLAGLVKKNTGKKATPIEVVKFPAWTDRTIIPGIVVAKADEFNWSISEDQWKSLTDLQRFALLKLCKGGHENRNFPKAMREFKLVSENE